MLVAYLFFCETVNTACDMVVMYEPLIVRNGTVEALTYAPIMLTSDPIIAVMVSLPVQLFIAWRIKILNNSCVLPIIIAIFSVASFIGGIANAVLITIIREYVKFPKSEFASIIWLVASAVADILITGTLVLSLMRRRTGIRVTDQLVNRIIRCESFLTRQSRKVRTSLNIVVTVQTGLVTAAFAILNVTLFMNFIFDFSLSKLYSNSLLSTLNARSGWKPSSTLQDNVLFGSQAIGLESTTRGHTHIEILSNNDHHASRHLKMVPVQAFESQTSCHRGDSTAEINDMSKYTDEI
ncbi:hypothetical protein JVU11DRAFT_7107 [Chiua virens]|nr:hypothetical protein JVU11DRAFT_7107 [Chiua virens]